MVIGNFTMKVEQILNETKVSLYGKATYNKPLKDISLMQWISFYADKSKDKVLKIREVNSYDEKSAKQMKLDLLPAISVTGHFPEYRRVYLADRMNPVICIDIDKDGNDDVIDWEKVKRDVMALPFVFYASLSCRGEGVFCYVYWDTTKDFLKVWYALERDFKEKLNITIDKNCKDITRLRFISYDSNTLIKKEVEMYSDEYEKYESCDTFDLNIKFNEDDLFIYKCIYHLIKECNYKSNDYNDWLQDGFRLATFGEYGKILFMMLSQLSDNYDEVDALKKWNECCRTSKKQKGCLTYYFKKLKDIYGQNWKQIIEKYLY